MIYEQGLRRLQKASKFETPEIEAPRVKTRGLVSPRAAAPVEDKDPLSLLSSFTDIIRSSGEDIRGKQPLS